MGRRRAPGDSSLTRRAVLGATATGAAGLAGCLERMRTTMATDEPDRVSLSIKTVPADEDRIAAQIARTLEEHFEQIGVEVDLINIREDELRQEVLLDHDFDIFVARFPNFDDPDFLRPVLHSRFSNELGWQNPFDFTYLQADDLLLEQRGQEGDERRDTVADLQRLIVREQPFAVVAIPEEIRCVRPDRFEDWGQSIHNPLNFLTIESVENTEQLRLGSTEGAITESLNPIAIRYHRRDTIIGLLYDSLGRSYEGAIRPWLAEEWNVAESDDGTIIRVELRPDLYWHDGSDLTPDDVAFTYRFLGDTTLGERETPVPAPRYRDLSSLVETATVVGDRSVRLSLRETSKEVAKRVLTVPLLPESEWGHRTGPGDLAGVSASTYLTEALVWENETPVGSGPFRFDSKSVGDDLQLRRFDDHVVYREHSTIPDEFRESSIEEIDIRIVPGDDTMIELLASGELDATISDMHPTVVPAIEDAADLELRIDSTQSFYTVGYNTRRAPLGNPRFRQIAGRLLDKDAIVDELLDGYGTAAASPLTGTDWLPEDLEWDEVDPELRFFGENNELDETMARESLQDAGFRYGEDGELLQR